MKLPSSVKVSGYTYTIKEEKGPTANGEPVLGYCDFNNQVICVHSLATFERKQNILWHEIMHAAFNSASVHLAERSLKNEELQEFIITHSTPVLVEVLKNNPKVASYLTHKGI